MNYKISLPVLENLEGYKSIIYVDNSSEISSKDSLELMATYFKKEFKYDHLQYCKDDDNSNCTGVLFAEKASDLVISQNHFPNRIIGGACFRLSKSGVYTLDWVWLHPFSRNRKKLRETWKEFKIKFGEFLCTKPLSAQMAKFLEKHA